MKNTVLIIILIWLGIMGIITFAAYGHDKRLAIKHKRRTPEKALFRLDLLGGCIGGWLGMFFFHHKTRHPSFYIVQLIGSVLWGGVLVFVYICV